MRLSRSSCLRNSSWLRPPKVCPFRLSICSIISRSSSSRISSRLRPAITHCTEDHGLVVLVVYQVVQSAQTFLCTACGFRSLCGLTNSSQWCFSPAFLFTLPREKTAIQRFTDVATILLATQAGFLLRLMQLTFEDR
jgi:hypothetical protein